MANIQERTTANGEKRSRTYPQKGYPSQSATFKRKTDAAKWARQTEAAMIDAATSKPQKPKSALLLI